MENLFIKVKIKTQPNSVISLIILLLLLFSFFQLSAQMIFSNSDLGDDTNGDGTYLNPYKSISKAYNMASNGDTIKLYGIFTINSTSEPNANTSYGVFDLNKNLVIIGPEDDMAIIQGASSKPSSSYNRIFSISYNTITFKNLLFRYGYPSVNTLGGNGGAIYANYSPLTIVNCYFKDNQANYGGAIYFTGNTALTIENSTFAYNFCVGDGGALSISTNQDVIITNTTISNNLADDWGDGAAIISNLDNDTYLTNCTVIRNASDGLKGGIVWDIGTFYFKNTLVVGNKANKDGDYPQYYVNTNQDLYYYNSGTVVDNGCNRVGWVYDNSDFSDPGSQTGVGLNGLEDSPSDNNTVLGTPTIVIDTYSSCINEGDTSANGMVAVPTLDQRGFSRNGQIDIGAYEYEGYPPYYPNHIIYANSITGSDIDGNGSFENPFKSFSKAYNWVVYSGDTIALTGEFTWTDIEEINVNSNSSFVIEKSVTILGNMDSVVSSGAIIQAASSLASSTKRIFNIDDNVTLENLELRYGNPTGSGGAIYVENYADIIIRDCYIHDNNSAFGGGLYFYKNSDSEIYNSTFTMDSASYRGGGIYVGNRCELWIYNSTIALNYAYDYGGGIYINDDLNQKVYLINNTIAINTSWEGCGIYNYESSLYLKNNIVANNIADVGGINDDYYNDYGSTFDWGYNIVELHNTTDLNATGTLTGEQTSLNLSSVLSINNTTRNTPTLALNSNSIAINAGDSSDIYYGYVHYPIPESDQRGFYRNGITDIGAFEYEGFPPPITQASNITFSEFPGTVTEVNWTRGNGDSCIVFMANASANNALPVNDSTYVADSTFGLGSQIGLSGWFCVYKGVGSSIQVAGLKSDVFYRVHVCEYNEGDGKEFYLSESGDENPKNLTFSLPINNSLDFDGVDDYVEITGSSEFNMSGSPFTIECLIRADDSYSSGEITFIGSGTSWNSGAYRLGAINDEKLIFGYFGWDASCDIDWSDSLWHHIAGVWDTHKLKIYFDGNLIIESEPTVLPGNAIVPMFLASRGGVNQFANVEMDEVRIWREARTELQIDSLKYISLANPFLENNLVTYYTFDDLACTNIMDKSIFYNNGILHNSSVCSLIFVDKDANGNNNGSSWANAFNNLQDALEIAGADNDIWVAEGVYYPDEGVGKTNNDKNASFNLMEGVSMYGGFAGGEVYLSERNISLHPTVLSGDIEQDDLNNDGNYFNQTYDSISGNNSYHVLIAEGTVSKITTGTILNGFIITAGYATSSASLKDGGGILFIGENNQSESSPSIVNCFFAGNRAYDNGGAVYVNGRNSGASNPEFNNCVFFGNKADNKGGSIYNDGENGSANPVYINCTISRNTARFGGAVNNSGEDGNCRPDFINCLIRYNISSSVSSEYNILNYSASPEFSYCNIEGSKGSGSSWPTSLGVDSGNNIDVISSFVDLINGDLRLCGTSADIDIGDNTANYMFTDIRGGGFLRKIDKSDHIQSGTIDIGAYEYFEGVDPQSQTIIYVKNDAIGINDGSSWDNAYTYLQDALSNSRIGQIIWVAAGVYYPDEGSNVVDNYMDTSFYLVEGVGIYGGFSGTETSLSERDIQNNPTILSGDIQQDDVNLDGNFLNQKADSIVGDNSYHVLVSYATDEGSIYTTVLDGFIIIGGSAIGTDYKKNYGGGLLCYSEDYGVRSNPILNNCSFHGNVASVYGGAVYVYSYSSSFSEPDFINCSFFGNNANYGGAIYNGTNGGTSYPTLSNCSFYVNTANFNGGAVYNTRYNGSGVQLYTNCILWNNSALNTGDQVYESSGYLRFSNCNIQGSYESGSWDSDLGSNYGNNIDTLPMFVDAENGNLLIYGASPCVDAGKNDANSMSTDIRGGSFLRKLDKNNGNSAGTIDIGAFEYKQRTDFYFPPIFVDADNSSGIYDGQTWSSAFRYLQDALSIADSGDVICVAEGVYYPDEGSGYTDNARDSSFNLVGGVSIYGGFSGTESNLSQRNYADNFTVLSGDIDKNDINFDGNYLNQNADSLFGNNSYSIITVNSNGSDISGSTELNGIIISSGLANGSSGEEARGAAIYCSNSIIGTDVSPAFINCFFTANKSDYGGAAYIFASNGTCNPEITNCAFSNNLAVNYGGAMFYNVNLGSCAPIITNCTFYGNYAEYGGAICGANQSSGTLSLILVNSILWGNTASYGPNIYNFDGNPSVSYCNIENSGGSGISNWDNSIGNDSGFNLDSNPFFNDADVGDFSLQSNSPVINSGSNVANSELLDLYTNERVYNDTIDMGVFEFSGGEVGIFETVASGNWHSPLTWAAVAIPSIVDTVIINSSHTAIISVNTVITNVKLKSGATLELNGNSILTINGDLFDGGGTLNIESGSQLILKGNIRNENGLVKFDVMNSQGVEIIGDIDVQQ